MKKHYNAILVLLILIAFATISFADADRNFKADLTGADEVLSVDTDTTGKAKFKVNKDFTKIKFKLEIKNAFKILGAAGAHIHCAIEGQNGPVVAFLAGVVEGGFDGKVKIEATLTDANIVVEAGCGGSIAELVDSMEDGMTYVNVHSIDNPDGEVRGQIH